MFGKLLNGANRFVSYGHPGFSHSGYGWVDKKKCNQQRHKVITKTDWNWGTFIGNFSGLIHGKSVLEYTCTLNPETWICHLIWVRVYSSL